MKSCCKEAFEMEPKEKIKSRFAKWFTRLTSKKREIPANKKVEAIH